MGTESGGVGSAEDCIQRMNALRTDAQRAGGVAELLRDVIFIEKQHDFKHTLCTILDTNEDWIKI